MLLPSCLPVLPGEASGDEAVLILPLFMLAWNEQFKMFSCKQIVVISVAAHGPAGLFKTNSASVCRSPTFRFLLRQTSFSCISRKKNERLLAKLFFSKVRGYSHKHTHPLGVGAGQTRARAWTKLMLILGCVQNA